MLAPGTLQVTDILRRLAEIREKAGYEPLPDPTKIQGFEPGSPAPPPLPPELERGPVDLGQVPEPPEPDPRLVQSIDMYEDETDDRGWPSPLIPRSQTTAPIQTPYLAVIGVEGRPTMAQYLGHEVELTDPESANIKTAVLKAMQRVVKAKLVELKSLTPRKRRAQPATPAPTLPKRRGRPPKVRGEQAP